MLSSYNRQKRRARQTVNGCAADTAGLQSENLEPRAMLSAVSFDVATGTLTLEAADGETNNVWVNGHSGNLNLRDQASIEIAAGQEEYFIQQSEQSVWVRGQAVQQVVLLLADGDDRVVAGGSRLPIFMDLGEGNDRVAAGSRVADEIYGGPGDDILYGYGGDDLICGEDGNDRLYGFAGDDTLRGGDGDDFLFGSVGDDALHGGDGDDELVGREGNDVLYGEAGNDVLRGGRHQDELFGGDGSDLLVAGLRGPHMDFVADGGPGSDVLWTSDLSRVAAHLKQNIEFDLPGLFRSTDLKRRDLFDWHGLT